MSFGYGEDLLQFIWEFQLYDATDLKTDTGESITILKQGYLNKNSGPDFENAEVRIGENLFYGSIEIHVDSKEWLHHKHHLDTAYNNVILHVCYTNSSTEERQDGTKMPSLTLKDKIDPSSLQKYELLMADKPFIPCENQIQNISKFDITNWLDRMVIERLEIRCQLFAENIESHQGNWN